MTAYSRLARASSRLVSSASLVRVRLSRRASMRARAHRAIALRSSVLARNGLHSDMASSASEANQRQCDTTICASRLRCARRAARAASGDIGDADARDGVEVVGCGWDDAEARPGVDAEARMASRVAAVVSGCVVVENPSASGYRRETARSFSSGTRVSWRTRLPRAVHRRVPREELTQRDVGAAARAHRRRRRARGSRPGDEEPLGASPRVPRRRREPVADARDPEPADAPRVLVLISVVHRGRGNRGRRRPSRVSRASAARVNQWLALLAWRGAVGEFEFCPNFGRL